MPIVRPFRALIYDRARVADPGRVLAPPYDVIDAAQRAELAARDPRNVVHLILPEDGADRYARAAARLREWIEEGALVRERTPALWVHAHEFDLPGRGASGRRTRTGVWAAVRLVELDRGEILPHERTLAGPKADRLALLRACRTQLSPIFFIAEDPSGGVAEAIAATVSQTPDTVCEFPAGERHTLRRVTGAAAEGLAGLLGRGTLLIADGHHRYETALAFRDEVREAKEGGRFPGAELVLAYIVSERDPGLVLLPTHRTLAGLLEFDAVRVVERVRQWFDVSELRATDTGGLVRALERGDPGRGATFVAWLRGQRSAVLLRLRVEAASRLPEALRDVPVAALHDVFLPEVFGLDAERQRQGGHLAFTRDADEALRRVRDGDAQAAFFLLPPTFAQLRAAAAAGARFPQKTTYFAPKVPTGIALRPLDEDV